MKIAGIETEVDSNATCGVTYFHDAAATEEEASGCGAAGGRGGCVCAARSS